MTISAALLEQIQLLSDEFLCNQSISILSPFARTLLEKRIAVESNRLNSDREISKRLRSDRYLSHLLLSDSLLVEKTHQRALREFNSTVRPRLATSCPTVTVASMTECGDPHASGITLRIDLSDGSTWYRKNKVDAIERELQHAYDLVDLPSPFCNWPAIHTENSTWQKGIVHAWASDPDSYFFNYGFMVAIMSFMHVSDLHNENVICNGVSPVPVDFEVANLGFIHAPTSRNDSQELVDGLIASLPTSTGMLPLNHSPILFGPGISPLETDTEESVFPFFDDAQQRFMLRVETKPAVSHLPIAKPQLSPEISRKYAKIILEGFDAATASLIQHGMELKASLFNSDSTQRRALIRHTMGYTALITKAFCYATDDPDRFITDTIARTSKHLSPQVKTREIECLRAGAIPKFIFDTSNDCLLEADQKIQEPAIIKILANHRYLWMQSNSIKYWYNSSRDLLTYCLGLNTLTSALPGSTRQRAKNVHSSNAVHPAKERLLRQIDEDRISSPRDNSHAWISVTVNSEESVAVSAIPDDVYFGSSGVIKGLRRTTQFTRAVSEEYYAQLDQALNGYFNDPFHNVGYYKGLLGIGSELKRLAPLAGKTFPERDFIDQIVAESLEAMGSNRQSLDMLMGTPGVIYALADNPEHALQPLINELIALVLDHKGSELVDHNYIVGNVSFAHGASGVLAALAQYARYIPCEPHLELAVFKLLRLERELGNGSLNDVRYGDNIDSLQWCNGSGGALISRALLASGPLNAVKEHVEHDIAQHLPNLIKYGNSLGNDCVCHGVAGSILILEFLQKLLPVYRKQLAITTTSFRQELAHQITTTGVLTATGMSQHSKGLLVGATGILCALEPNNSEGIIVPEW